MHLLSFSWSSKPQTWCLLSPSFTSRNVYTSAVTASFPSLLCSCGNVTLLVLVEMSSAAGVSKRPANLDVLFKAVNAHFHLTALETVSSPGTLSCHVKPRMIPTWSRVKHNPGNQLRCYRIGPFCTASAFGCRKSLPQQDLFYWLIFLQSADLWLHSQLSSCIFAIYHLYR